LPCHSRHSWGPQSQYDYSFQFEAQLFAANIGHPSQSPRVYRLW
jgi:hypothetical protein